MVCVKLFSEIQILNWDFLNEILRSHFTPHLHIDRGMMESQSLIK